MAITREKARQLRTKRMRYEGKDIQAVRLYDFIGSRGPLDIDVVARTNYGMQRLVKIGKDAKNIYCITDTKRKIYLTEIRPDVLSEIAEQLGIEEKRMNGRSAMRRGRRFGEAKRQDLEQPDFGVINSSSDGSRLFLVTLAHKAQRDYSTMLVWADEDYEALDIAAYWCDDNAPEVLADDYEVSLFITDLVAIYLRTGVLEEDELKETQDMSDSELLDWAEANMPDLYYDLYHDVEDTNDFREVYNVHDNGIYTHAEGTSVVEVDPDDYEDVLYDERY